MPIHIGAETDLRFMYCAGKEIDMFGKLNMPFDEILKITHCCFSCHLFYVGGLEGHG